MGLLPVAAALLALSSNPRQSTPEPQCPVRPPDHLRITDCRLATALRDALDRSPTLRKLSDRIAALNGIVYLSTAVVVLPGKSRQVRGVTADSVTQAGNYRIVNISVIHDYTDAGMGTVAHELQHAVERLEGTVNGAEYAVFSGAKETTAAIDTEKAVLRELKAAKSHRS